MLGKTFMFPIALLSVSGMMLGLGAGFTDPKMIEMVPFLGNEYVNLVLNFMLTIGLFAFNNLGALFAMAIPLGLLKKEKEFGAFSGLVGFIAMHIGTNFYLTRADLLVPAEQMSTNGQAMIMALKGLLISGVLTVIIGGISEPIEFLFLFISPALFAFHTFMNGLANMVLPYLGVLMGFTGDLIAFISFGVLRGTATGWPIAVLVAVLYFAIYYFVFKWAIIKFNIKTPGREDKEIKVSEGNGSDFKNLSTYKGQQMISALGGQSNILSLDNCVTRLRLKLQDVSLINEDAIKEAGGIAVVKLDEHTIQVIIGTQVYSLRKQMDKAMEGHLEACND
ncbi:hypothetical protein BM529_06435 [Clostridioides difficile]|nr:hypothetical protein BM529_06435 [Clostridioides difficile]